MSYRNRLIESSLQDKLDAMGALLIEGPKACGKTTTAEQIAKSKLYMDDPEQIEQNLQMASTNIKKLLQGATPRLIDEWQLAPQLWDAIRFEVDHRGGEGLFILTGSAVPADVSRISHSGAGRFGWITMRTMSLWESGDSSGEVSLSALFRGEHDVWASHDTTIDQLAYLICRGGWPRAVMARSERSALLQVGEYYHAITRSDISRVDNVKRNAERVQRLMRSYSRYQGTQVAATAIMSDLSANEKTDISLVTIEGYLSALRKIFIIEDLPAWNPNLRSRTAIRTSDTRYFADSSIATTALGIGPEDLVNDLRTFGLFFETLAIHDLRIYAETIGGSVYHYRDSNGLECDAVIHLRNGSYGLVEIKLGGDKLIEEGAKNLHKLASIIDTTKMKSPSFLMILIGVGTHAFQRKDGVLVVPLSTLRE